jgi:hypothetical protein
VRSTKTEALHYFRGRLGYKEFDAEDMFDPLKLYATAIARNQNGIYLYIQNKV